ncbi:hypothetical protein B0H11DRAFT_1905101 [Mycena galericulata]|nr:hypothetical protein B0H11DRAFT_1905101 [Mycena galericulata]
MAPKNANRTITPMAPLIPSENASKSSIPSRSAPRSSIPPKSAPRSIPSKNASKSTTRMAPLIPSKNAPNSDLRPSWKPIATMVARGAERPEFDFHDRVLASKLYEKITKKKKLAWTLHSKLNIPKCRDELSCSICNEYVKHVEEARGSGGRGVNEDDQDDEDDEDDWQDQEEFEGPGEDLDMGESSMDCLFRLQDLLGKSRYVSWSDKTRKITEASGMVAAMQAQAMAEEKCDAAQAGQVALSTRLELLQVKADDTEAKFEALTMKHGGVVAERDHARQQLRETESQLTSAIAERDHARQQLRENDSQLTGALAELQQAKQQLATTQTLLANAEAEVKQLGDEGRIDHRPRKRPKTAVPLSVRAKEEKVWTDLNQMRRPLVTDPAIDIAHFLQFNEEVDFKGIPLHGAQWMVDMRDVRGYREVMGRAPRKTKAPDNFQHFAHCVTRLLRILTIPGEYGRLLKEQGVTVTAAEDLSPCDFGDYPAALSNGQVARLLADRGLSLATADDAWQFCHNYVKAQAASPDKFFDKDAMRQLLSDVGPHSAPSLQPIADDVYPRSIPSKHRSDRRPTTNNNWRNSRSRHP